MTTTEFKNKAYYKNKYYRNGEFEIIGEYINMKSKILCKNKYSLHLKKAEGIVKGENVSSKTTTDYKEYYYNYLLENSQYFKEVKDGFIDIVKENKQYFCIISTSYGNCKISVDNLLKNVKPSIKSAINKTEYLVNQLKELDIGITDYSLIKYKNATSKVTYNTKYGLCQMIPNSLLYCDRADTINSALSKTEYIKNVIKNERGEKYDLQNVEHIDNMTPIKIGCRLHGIFEVPTANFTGKKSYRGCPKCGRIATKEHNINNPIGWSHNAWENAGKLSKYFDSYKVYILECWNDYELFYKIGRTFLKTERRFRSNKIPYNYKILYEFVHIDAKFICTLENKLKLGNNNNKYKPSIEFEGMYECFSNIEDIQLYINVIKDKLK